EGAKQRFVAWGRTIIGGVTSVPHNKIVQSTFIASTALTAARILSGPSDKAAHSLYEALKNESATAEAVDSSESEDDEVESLSTTTEIDTQTSVAAQTPETTVAATTIPDSSLPDSTTSTSTTTSTS